MKCTCSDANAIRDHCIWVRHHFYDFMKYEAVQLNSVYVSVHLPLQKLIAAIISACCLPLSFEFRSECQRCSKIHWHLQRLRHQSVFFRNFWSVRYSVRLDENLERKARSNGTFSTLIRFTNNNFTCLLLASNLFQHINIRIYWLK